MDYPNNFNLSVFPAARKIAFARALSIWSLVAFAVIAMLCGLLLWGVASLRLNPFIISIKNDTGEWTVIGEKINRARYASPLIAMQESLVANFAQDWFKISSHADTNNARWCRCNRARCGDFDSNERCDICCAAAEGLYLKFSNNMLPEMSALSDIGVTRSVIDSTIQITPMSNASESGGTWRVTFTLMTTDMGNIDIVAFARVARTANMNPLTLGFYVADFNAYVVE